MLLQDVQGKRVSQDKSGYVEQTNYPTLSETESNKGVYLAYTIQPKQMGGRLCSLDPG